jgi:hypothetical protein
MRVSFVVFSSLVLAAAGLQQYVAFDAASASSTYSAGNLAGSPAFAAQQALSGGSGYWCSSGSHTAGQSVTWTGVLNSRRLALGVKVDWAYAPGEVKILTSSDGANFEEAKCWQSSTRTEVAFEESFMFDAPRNVKAVAITMRSPQSWGYFGINSAALVAEPGPFMLVSGITSGDGEQCLVTGASGVTLESCLEAIAAGDGREVLQFDKDGQIMSMADGSCMVLADGDTSGGGSFATEACSTSAESGDGRTVFSLTPGGQLKMPRLGNYCVTMAGEGAAGGDIAQGSDLTATSTNAQHNVKNAADGDAQSYWASASDPAAPVDVQLDFGDAKHIKSIEIEWEHPAQAYELQVANGGRWTSIYSTSGNNLHATRYVGPAVSGSALKIRMSTPHPTLGSSGGHALYAIKAIRVLASSVRAVAQDCVEAEDNTDARDKFFMVAVPAFDPSSAAAAKQHAALLGAAEEHLGNLLAELYVAMPSLAACGFRASFGKQPQATTLMRQASSRMAGSSRGRDGTSAALAAVTPSVGVDTQALHALVSQAREALAQITA